jgi:putative glutathione S-transferase
MGEDGGWNFRTDFEGATGDSLFGKRYLHEVYLEDTPDVTTRVTVPTLWDRAQGRIVSNESAEIVRMFNAAFDGITGNRDDYYPAELREAIDAINDPVYHHVNNGVYKSGFATTQEAYEEAVRPLFETLDMLEDRLTRNRYLTGERLTEADVRLFTTLVRFDAVYYSHFKCNVRRIDDYPALSGYLRELYQMPAFRPTVDLAHIKHHYYSSHESINPTRIVPVGPELDLDTPHGRDRLKAA